MSLVTVVVPIYNVAPYLADCLDSIAGQTHRALDVILVDDGSTDGSETIAERYAEQDPRFRLVRQPNGGLGNARNNGAALANGDYLAFVDSDDVLAPTAYELLVGSLEQTGSDFATGRFRRLTTVGSRPAYFVARAFAKDRPRTHIRRFHDLAVDRTAWNKVFKRSFWDRHSFRFGEGVTYEDYYATLPAHFQAEAVDVLSATVYHWRIRESGESISQRREQPQEVLDRVAAVATTSRYLAQASPGDKAWYEHTALRLDLGYAPQVLVGADGAERDELLQRLQAWYLQTDPAAAHGLPAPSRLTWELVGRGALDDLATMLDALPTDDRPVPAVRRRGSWVADLPLQDRLALELYRVDEELSAVATVTDVELAGQRLSVQGSVSFERYEPVGARGQRMTAWLAAGGGQRIELQVQPSGDAGFTAGVDIPELTRSSPVDKKWVLHVEVRGRRLGRPAASVSAAEPAPRSSLTELDDGRLLRLDVGGRGGLRVHVQSAACRLVDAVVDGESLRLRGAADEPVDGVELMLASSSERTLLAAVASLRGGWEAVVPLRELSAGLADPTAPQSCRRADAVDWTMALTGSAGRRQVWHSGADALIRSDGRRELALSTNGAGLCTLSDRRRRPQVGELQIDETGVAFAVAVPEGVVPDGYVAVGPAGVERELTTQGDSGRLVVPADTDWLGTWRLCWRDPHGPTAATHLGVAPRLLDRPCRGSTGAVAVAVGRDRAGAVIVNVDR